MSPRIKATSFSNRAEFDDALDQIAQIQVAIRKAEAERDRAIQQVRDTFEPKIQGFSERVRGLALLAEKFAESHRGELLPPDRKSGETALAVYGFRTGNPTLKLLSKRWNWEGVLEAVKRHFPGRFVRTTEAVEKDSLKAQLTDEQLATVGLRVDQAETFYVEAKEQPSEQAA